MICMSLGNNDYFIVIIIVIVNVIWSIMRGTNGHYIQERSAGWKPIHTFCVCFHNIDNLSDILSNSSTCIHIYFYNGFLTWYQILRTTVRWQQGIRKNHREFGLVIHMCVCVFFRAIVYDLFDNWGVTFVFISVEVSKVCNRNLVDMYFAIICHYEYEITH